MSGSWLLVGVLLFLAAILPILLLGVVRFAERTAPAAGRWERRHRTGFNAFLALVYLLLAISFFSPSGSVSSPAGGGLESAFFESVPYRIGFGAWLAANGLGFLLRAVRNRRSQSVAGNHIGVL